MKLNRKQDFLNITGKDPKTLDELADCIIQVINNTQSEDKTYFKVAGFSWNIIHGNVSNSHDCPMLGVTNWGNRDKDKPTSYPGWSGRVWIRYAADFKWGGSDGFRKTLTYPGTGGAGSYSGPWAHISHMHYHTYRHRKVTGMYPAPIIYSWDYRFFEDDWPTLKLNYEKERNWLLLQNKQPYKSHSFIWQDPEFVKSDKAFLDSFKEVEPA